MGISYSPIRNNDKIRLLIFGGSQGAKIFSELVPPAITLLPDNLLRKIEITQQCRAEDLELVANIYKKAKINFELAEFFADLPERMADSHLIICRSGASSVAELSMLGRPAVLIPLPGALDADQAHNAAMLESVGGAWVVEQANISAKSLAKQLEELLTEPEILTDAAKKAKSIAQPRAVEKLADLAERVIDKRVMNKVE